MREGIELVVVALGAADAGAEPDGAGGVDAVDDLLHAVLLGVGAGLEIQRRVAMEAGGDQLLRRRLAAAGRRPVCSMVNWSKGMSALSALTTQSR